MFISFLIFNLLQKLVGMFNFLRIFFHFLFLQLIESINDDDNSRKNKFKENNNKVFF